MASRDRNRKWERRVEMTLSFAGLCVLLPALALVFCARWRVEVPADALLVNEANSEKFALALNLDVDLADRLMAARSRVGGFGSVDSVLDARLFARSEAERLTSALSAAHLDLQTATPRQLGAILGLTPAVAARLASYRDESMARVRSHRPPNPTVLLHRATVLDPVTVRPRLGRLIIRRPGTIFWHFALVAGLLALTLFLLPPWLRNRVGLDGDPYLIPLSLLLSGLGVVMLFSVKDPLRDPVAYEHHAVGIALSLVAMVFCARLAPRARLRLKNYRYTWVFGAALLVLLLLLFGSGPEGVKLDLLGFQPVELVKLMLVLFLAGYLAERADLIADVTPRGVPGAPRSGLQRWADALPRKEDLGPVAVLFALSLVLFYVLKDLGPGLLLFATFIALLYMATGRGSFLLIGTVLILCGGLLGYWRHIGVFPTRVDMWLSPFSNRHPNGMQLAQAYWALASGGWAGSGLGLGMPGGIPRGQDDLAFISWTEEAGLPGAWLALLIYAVLVWRGIRIALRAGNEFDRMLAFGLTALLGLQTLLILTGVTGITPLTGISLPFFCYGDSALLAAFIIVGLLRGISVPPAGGVGRPVARPEVVRAGNLFAFAISVLLLGVIGVWRLGHIQVVAADEIATRPAVTPDADGVARPHQNPRLLAMADAIERGSIYDRTGRIVATSRLKEILTLVRDPASASQLQATRTRLYPFGAALADLVGYVDPMIGGPYGLERSRDADLRGYVHLKDLLRDYRARHNPGFLPRRGHDLHLAIDAPLQRSAQEILWQITSRLKDERTGRPKDRAALVLMDPQTGDLLAAATIPAFDPSTLTSERYHSLMSAKEPEQEYPFIDRARDGYYPPGSTLKVATAACALENLPDALNFRVTCNRVGDVRWHAQGRTFARTVHDDKGDPAFGPLTLAPAFRVSSNIYFATLAAALGPEALHGMLADRLAFRHAPSTAGLGADLADVGYGQGRMLVSPLEMARLAATVANEGKMMEARLVTSLTDPAGIDKARVYSPVVRSQAMTPHTAEVLRDLMRTVVTGGTAHGVFDGLPVTVGGKTGTAQNRQLDRQPHSWFIGIAPAADHSEPNTAPRYAFACVVENGGYGRAVAAAACRNLLKKLY